jgi:hypothetical protein
MGETARIERGRLQQRLELGGARGHDGKAVQRCGALQAMREDVQRVELAARGGAGRVLERGDGLPRLHQEDGAQKLPVGRLNHGRLGSRQLEP